MFVIAAIRTKKKKKKKKLKKNNKRQQLEVNGVHKETCTAGITKPEYREKKNPTKNNSTMNQQVRQKHLF